MQQSYDVVIVGGGAMGSSTAYFLSSSSDFNGSVLVVERDPTYESCATTRSLGGIRQQFSTPENIKMSMFGAEFARGAAATLAVEGQSADVTFREQGYLFTATPAGAEVLHRNYELQRGFGAEVTFLEPPALAARFPWLRTDDLGAAVFGHANEGWVDPNTLLQGFRRKARALGAEFVADEVVGFAREGDRITGVTLAAGGAVVAGTVVMAAGSRSGKLCRHLGFEFPVWPRKRYVYVFDCREDFTAAPLTIDPSGVAFRPESGQYLGVVSPSEDQDPESDPDDFEIEYDHFEELVWPKLAHRIPAFEAIKLTNAWAGHYEYNTFDQNAILGPHPEIAGLLLCAGFSGHGLQQSPAAGRATAELVSYGEYRAIDLERFGFERILKGIPIREANVW
jgi:sarcosine oxidase